MLRSSSPSSGLRFTAGVALLAALLLPVAVGRKVVIEGHVSHGANIFNGALQADFSAISSFWSGAGPMAELGALNPGGANSSLITSSTPPHARLATLDAGALQANFGFPRGAGPYNVPVANTPVLYLGSRNVNDRVAPQPFAAAAADPYVGAVPYVSATADDDVRLRDWNRAAAFLNGRCGDDGTASVTIRVRRALPNALYSIVELGVLDALTDKERPLAGAFGGLPNVMLTDARGEAKVWRKLPYCPFDKCEKGKKRCTLYISLFYHFDHAVYGAAPALNFAGPAVGNVGANHITLFINGKVLQRRQNSFWK